MWIHEWAFGVDGDEETNFPEDDSSSGEFVGESQQKITHN